MDNKEQTNKNAAPAKGHTAAPKIDTNMREIIKNIGAKGYDAEFKKVDRILNKATKKTLFGK